VLRFGEIRLRIEQGYGAFTHSHSQIDNVANYILDQERYHKKRLFKEEYWEMLEKNNVDFNQEYLFEFFDDSNEWD
jgi:hypothetical protein